MIRKGIARVSPRRIDWEAIELRKREIRRLDSIHAPFVSLWNAGMPYSGIFSLVYNKRIYYTIEIFPEFLQRTSKVIWKCRKIKAGRVFFPACLLFMVKNGIYMTSSKIHPSAGTITKRGIPKRQSLILIRLGLSVQFARISPSLPSGAFHRQSNTAGAS